MRIACRDEELRHRLVEDWRRDSLQSEGVFEKSFASILVQIMEQ